MLFRYAIATGWENISSSFFVYMSWYVVIIGSSWGISQVQLVTASLLETQMDG